MRKFVLLMLAVLMTGALFAQNRQVSGTVTNEDGEPVVGAAVSVQGTSAIAVTDVDGSYTIAAPADGTLVVTLIGMENATVAVNNRAVVDVQMATDAEMIDDVIVVAFGVAKRDAFTGSAGVVNAEDIAKTQSTSVVGALEGLVAGVQMNTSSGRLGANPSIRIRGTGSLSAGTAPLYVVDGIPFSGDLNNINMADVESMTVLKDAASNALYGARGANGVIIITTKRAKLGDAVVNFDAKWGVNTRALQTYDYITDPAQYYETHFAALHNYYLDRGDSALEAHELANKTLVGTGASGGLGYQIFDVPENEYFIGTNGRVNPNATLGRVISHNGTEYLIKPDNWMDEAYKTGFRQEYNVSVSGANEKSSVYASFGYLNNEGIIDGNDMFRYTARLRADYQAKKWLKVGANAGYTNFNWNNGNADEGIAGSTGNIFGFAATMAPIYPVYIRYADGSIARDANGLQMYDYGDGMVIGLSRPANGGSNALQSVTLDRDNSEGNALTGTGFAEVTFLKDFKFTLNAGVSLDETRRTATNNMFYGQFAVNGGTIYKGHSRIFDTNLQQLLTYAKTLNDIHNFDAMVGHEYYKHKTYGLSANKSNMFSPDNLELDGAVVDSSASRSSATIYNNEGYFARVQYDYDERVFLSGSFRRDASSRFHPDHRWGNFWSLGAGWLIQKESWFNVPWVNMLKLKASIGSQGNDEIGNYRYIDTYSVDNSDGQVAVTFNTKGNPDITWETNTNLNTGVEFGLWNDRLTGSIEYFNRKTSDMLFFFPVASSLGYNGYYDNIGDMRNSGVEIDLNVNIMRTKDLNWDFYVNATHYKNKVVRLPEENKTRKIEGYEGYVTGNKYRAEGLPIYTYFLREYAGVDQATGKSMWYQDELDGDGNVTGRTTTTEFQDATEYIQGDPTPDIYGGFGTSVRYKGFDFAASFTYSIGGKVYDSGYASAMDVPGTGTGTNFHKDVLDAWTPENTDSNIPRFQYLDTNVSGASDRFLADASYLNIQNAQLGYTLPTRITEKLKVQRVRVYVACDNIFYWSSRRGLDPRYSFDGATNYANYSPIRTISGGVNLSF